MNPTTSSLAITNNRSDCIRSADYITYTHYVNTCTGKSYDVARGPGDYVLMSFLTILVAMLFGVFILVIKQIILAA